MDPNALCINGIVSASHFLLPFWGSVSPLWKITSQAHMLPLGESLCHLPLAVNLLGMHNDDIAQWMWLRWTSQPPCRRTNPHSNAHVRCLVPQSPAPITVRTPPVWHGKTSRSGPARHVVQGCDRDPTSDKFAMQPSLAGSDNKASVNHMGFQARLRKHHHSCPVLIFPE